MRVSRTRFSKRRVKRKTEFPIVAVVQKKRKVESIKSQSFRILSNKAGATKEQRISLATQEPANRSYKAPQVKDRQRQNGDGNLQDDKVLAVQNGGQPLAEGGSLSSLDFAPSENRSKMRQKLEALKPQKKSRASIDYKNVTLLRNLITAEGKILPRRISKLTAKQQRSVQKAIKSARIMGLIPFINKSRPF